jgi:hypothetical protein
VPHGLRDGRPVRLARGDFTLTEFNLTRVLGHVAGGDDLRLGTSPPLCHSDPGQAPVGGL